MQKHPTTSHFSKPFLKWAGGKGRLLPKLIPLLPKGNRLIEPFVGAGAVFLAAKYNEYVINDANPDLIAIWVALQSRSREFILRAEEYFSTSFHSEEAYLRVRFEFNLQVDRFERAVRLPYLNKFGFNGLFRVNAKGKFNVPYGQPKSLPRFPYEEIKAASMKLEHCLVLGGGFEAAIALAGKGDIVYCDPPYLSSLKGNSFTGYTASTFGIAEHRRLVEASEFAVARGATVLISNHDTVQTRSLYQAFDIDAYFVNRSMSANSSSRGLVPELVASLPRWFNREVY